MATGVTPTYDLPYPLITDPVNVHEDIQSLAEQLELVLPSIGLSAHTIEVKNVSGSSITKGDPVYITGFDVKTTVAKSQATNLDTFPILGLAQSTMSSGTEGVVVISGVFSNINTTSYAAGNILYVGSTGGLTTTRPATGSSAVAVVAKSGSAGILIVGQLRGNGTWGSLKAGLA
jgi:hypothetical protein